MNSLYPKLNHNQSSYEPILPQDGKVDFTAQNRIRGNEIRGLDGLREAINSWSTGKAPDQTTGTEAANGASTAAETAAKPEPSVNFKDLMESMNSTGRASLGRAFSKLDNMTTMLGGFGIGGANSAVNAYQSLSQYQFGGAYNQGMFNQLLNAYA
jgi:hypothetical protein